MSRQSDYEAKIKEVAARGELPRCTTIDEATHVFHWEDDDDFNDAEILLVNKNGHHFRLIQQEDGQWQFVKTWNGLFDTLHWQVVRGMKRLDPKELMRLAGTGPQGNSATETLCLLPKLSTRKRKAVWRDQMLDVQFDMDNDRFRLSPVGKPDQMSWFPGKVWESSTASHWCLSTCGTGSVFVPPAQVAVERQAAVEEMEEAGVWGIF